jgi:hypothetical protein
VHAVAPLASPRESARERNATNALKEESRRQTAFTASYVKKDVTFQQDSDKGDFVSL